MIIFSFAMITIFMTYSKIKTGNIEVYSDWSFHGLRAEQIFLNLKRGNFLTFIATDAFQHTGVGNFLFYPTVFLYPWAVLRLFFQTSDRLLLLVRFNNASDVYNRIL